MLGLNAADFLKSSGVSLFKTKKDRSILSGLLSFINLNALVFVERRFHCVCDCCVKPVFLQRSHALNRCAAG